MQHTETGNGDRADPVSVRPVPSGETPPVETAPEGELERLKDILLDNERRAIDALDARVDTLDRAQRELPSRLPVAIERAQQGAGAPRMAQALSKTVTHALGAAVRENRQVIIDVLFPVIGPAIRKAIAEALRNLVADVNGAIESSFTPRGIRWRIEALRSGVPYAQIVLKHTLTYRIDHVFLIERGSGLVLDRESAPHLPELDADAIGGMLTAIGEFVRDSVGRDGSGTLDSARVGEHLLWVVQGPRANLACFIHGVPPPRLRALLEQRLEKIHAAFGELDANAGADDAWRNSLRPEQLMREVRASEAERARASSRLPLLLLLVVAAALIAWMIVHHERHVAWIEQLRTKLTAHPGFVLTGIEARGAALTVQGLLDPDAEPLDVEASGRADAEAEPVTFDTVGYVSTDDSVIARRARRLLAAPATVTIDVKGGVLALGGHTAAPWVDATRERAAWISGVRSVQFAVTRDTDAATLAREQLEALARSIPERRVVFVRDTELAPESGSVLDDLVGDALRAQSLAATAGVGIELIATGANDDPGSDATNARVRAARAHWLADALGARGISGVRAAANDDAESLKLRQRSAFLRLTIVGAAR